MNCSTGVSVSPFPQIRTLLQSYDVDRVLIWGVGLPKSTHSTGSFWKSLALQAMKFEEFRV